MNKPVRGEPWEWAAAEDSDEQTGTLRDYVGMVLQSWKLVLSIVSLAGLVGLYFALTAEPVYQSNALIQVEQKKGGAALLDSMAPMSELFEGQSLSAGEIEILRSRSITEEVIQALKLDISAKPRYFGAIGAAMARAYGNGDQLADLAKPPLSMLARYAWGGERITVSRLGVPRELAGKELVLTAGAKGAYHVLGPEGEMLLRGEVGKAAQGKAPSGAPIKMYVAQLKTRQGAEFLLTKWPLPEAVERLQEDLRVAERGTKTGILEITLDGPSPQEVEKRLNAIANAYLGQNVARESEEAHKTLDFVNSQLPELRAKVDETEAALRDYQAKKGTVDLSLEAQAMLRRLTANHAQISKLDLQKTEMMRLYTEGHPMIESLENKRARLGGESVRIEQQLKKLPDVQSDFLRLSRDAQVANELYLLLLNRAQELKVVEAGVTGFVRIIDHAFAPLLPSGPSRPRIVFVAVVLGFMCAMGLLLLRQALVRALETPDPIERKLGIPVYATIPHSKQQADLYRQKRKRTARAGEPEVLARSAATDNAVESLRSLRTSLQFALIENENNVVAISGPTPGLGKTFVAVNLAFLLGDIDKRVLLIDADMRRGHVHKYMGLPRSPGLSDVIAGRCELDQAIHAVGGDKVHFMSTGTMPPNPSELLVHDGFRRLIEVVSKRFDLVLIDTPPMLNVTDSIIIGRHSGTNFIVVRGGSSTLHDVELSVRRMQQNDIKLSGVIFNDLKANATRYGYGKYGYYTYQYKPAKAEA